MSKIIRLLLMMLVAWTLAVLLDVFGLIGALMGFLPSQVRGVLEVGLWGVGGFLIVIVIRYMLSGDSNGEEDETF